MADNDYAPGIVARITDCESKVRLYIHKAGIERFPGAGSFGDVKAAWNYFMDTCPKYGAAMVDGNTDYSLAMVWNDEGESVVDFFRFSGIEHWPDNPEMHGFVFRNGVYSPGEAVTCGDGMIILGIEEQHRRRSKDLASFMRRPPEIPGVKLKEDIMNR